MASAGYAPPPASIDPGPSEPTTPPVVHPVSRLPNVATPPQSVNPDASVGLLGSTTLQRLAAKYDEAVAGNQDISQFLTQQQQVFVFDAQDRVLVNVRGRDQDQLDKMQADLTDNFHMVVTTVTPDQNMVTGYLPISAIPLLPSANDYSAVTPVYAPIVRSGSVVTAGDQALQADVFRAQYNDVGQGITIGVLSDSVDQVDTDPDGGNPDVGIAESQRTGDLPAAGVNVLQDGSGHTTDEGRAMLEVIHDVAPGSALAFHTATSGPQNFAQGIHDLATQAGANVIVDDVAYPDEPFFNDGVITRAINDVYFHNNVVYVTAAGNEGNHAWTVPFEGVTTQVGDAPYSTFANVTPGAGEQVLQHFHLEEGQTLDMAFQWDSAYLEGGSPDPMYQVPNEMDVLVTTGDGTSVLATFNDMTQNTDEALQRVVFTNDGSFGTNDFAMAFPLAAGPAPGQLRWVRFDNNAPVEFEGRAEHLRARGFPNRFECGRGSGLQSRCGRTVLLIGGIAVAVRLRRQSPGAAGPRGHAGHHGARRRPGRPLHRPGECWGKDRRCPGGVHRHFGSRGPRGRGGGPATAAASWHSTAADQPNAPEDGQAARPGRSRFPDGGRFRAGDRPGGKLQARSRRQRQHGGGQPE